MTVAKTKSINDKLGGLLGSIRFWQITIAATVFAVAHPEELLNTIAGWLTAVAAVGTIDKANEGK